MTKSKQADLEAALDEAQDARRLFAVDTGTMRRRLERHVASGELLKPFPGHYVRTTYWERLKPLDRHTILARSYYEGNPTTVFCGVTAAALLGYGPPYRLLGRLHTVSPRGSYCKSTHLVVRHTEKTFETVVADDVRVTSPERTVFDCLRTLPFTEGLAIADAACRIHGWAPSRVAEIVESLSEDGGYRGVRRARLVAEYVDPRSENGGESIARANMLLAGFCCPDLQVEIANPIEATGPFRADFAWFADDGTLIVGELDGRQKYTDDDMAKGDVIDVVLRERLRESRISAVGAKIVRFDFQQANNRDALARILDLYGVPRRQASKLTPTSLKHSIRMGGTEYMQEGTFGFIACQYRWLD